MMMSNCRLREVTSEGWNKENGIIFTSQNICGVNLKYKQGRLKSLGTGRCERNKCLKWDSFGDDEEATDRKDIWEVELIGI